MQVEQEPVKQSREIIGSGVAENAPTLARLLREERGDVNPVAAVILATSALSLGFVIGGNWLAAEIGARASSQEQAVAAVGLMVGSWLVGSGIPLVVGSLISRYK